MSGKSLRIVFALIVIAVIGTVFGGCRAGATKTTTATDPLTLSLIKAADPAVAEARAICSHHKDAIRQIPGIPGYVRTGTATLLPADAVVTKSKSADIPYTGVVSITIEYARPSQPHYDTKEDAQNADLSVKEQSTTKHNFEYKGNKWIPAKPKLPQMAG